MKINGTRISPSSVISHDTDFTTQGEVLRIEFYSEATAKHARFLLNKNSTLEVHTSGTSMRVFSKKITIT